MSIHVNCINCGGKYPIGQLVGNLCRSCIRQQAELDRAEQKRNELASDLVHGKAGEVANG